MERVAKVGRRGKVTFRLRNKAEKVAGRAPGRGNSMCRSFKARKSITGLSNGGLSK